VNEQPVNLRASLHELWRRRLLLVVVALLGALAGIVIGYFSPSQPDAIALVLLPPNTPGATSGGATADVHTGAVIARSTPVLAAAGAKVSPPLSAAALKSRLTVNSVSGQVLQILVKAPQSSDAVQLANAVATSFVNYIGQLQSTSAGSGVAALQQESSLFSQQIRDLQSQIDTVSARISAEGAASNAGQQDANLLSSLQNEQNQVSIQLNNVTNQIAAAQLASGAGVNTTRVLQPATAQASSKNGLFITAGIIGFFVGLLAAMVFVLVRLQRTPRLWRRDDIARATRAPVIASLESPGCSTSSAWRALLANRPRASDEWALRQLLHTVLRAGRQRQVVRVISLAGDTPALTTGPRLAVFAATTGVPAALIPEDMGNEDRSLAPLRATFTGTDPVGQGLPFSLGVDEVRTPPSQLVVSIMIKNDAPAEPVPGGTITLLSISPNVATREELAQLALDAADGGWPLSGVILVNPDPADRTTGLIVDDTVRLLAPGADPEREEKTLLPVRAEGGTITGSVDRLLSSEH
jgi:capsular polysaccharide biosynthesis protein